MNRHQLQPSRTFYECAVLCRGETYPGGIESNVQMFTFIGPILIAVNPYQSLPIFTKEFIKLYYEQVHATSPVTRLPCLTRNAPQRFSAELLPPHCYQVTNKAYLQMLNGKRNQSMVISGEFRDVGLLGISDVCGLGESGAGKTETTKICLSFLAEVAGYVHDSHGGLSLRRLL